MTSSANRRCPSLMDLAQGVIATSLLAALAIASPVRVPTAEASTIPTRDFLTRKNIPTSLTKLPVMFLGGGCSCAAMTSLKVFLSRQCWLTHRQRPVVCEPATGFC